MRASVNIHEAKTHLSRLLESVQQGETVIIAKAGTPIAKIIPFEKSRVGDRTGFLPPETNIPEDFDTMFDDEIAALFGSTGD